MPRTKPTSATALVVMSIFVRMGRRLAPVVERQRLRRNKRACNTGIQSHTHKAPASKTGKVFIGFASFICNWSFGRTPCGVPSGPEICSRSITTPPSQCQRIFPRHAPWPAPDFGVAACLECAHGWLCHQLLQSRLNHPTNFCGQPLRLGISRQLIPPIVGPVPVSSLCRQSSLTQTAVLSRLPGTRLRRSGNIPFPCYFPNEFLDIYR